MENKKNAKLKKIRLPAPIFFMIQDTKLKIFFARPIHLDNDFQDSVMVSGAEKVMVSGVEKFFGPFSNFCLSEYSPTAGLQRWRMETGLASE